MKLRYTPQARLHLDAIAEYVGARNPAAAQRIGARIEEMINLLAAFPNMGRKGQLPGTHGGAGFALHHRLPDRKRRQGGTGDPWSLSRRATPARAAVELDIRATKPARPLTHPASRRSRTPRAPG